MDPMVRIALRAARRAGPILLNTFDRSPVSRMGRVALAEFSDWSQARLFKELSAEIKQAFPDHQIDDVRVNRTIQKPIVTWKILPIDGLSNYYRSIPSFCTLIGIYEYGQLMHSIIFDYVMDDEYWASANRGARCAQHRMRVSSAHQSKDSLVVIVPPESKEHRRDTDYGRLVNKIRNDVEDTRRSGCTVLDIAQVANGKLDAILAFDIDEQMLEPAFLLIKEAGGYVNFERWLNQTAGRTTMIGGTPKVFNQLSVLIRKTRKVSESERIQ